MQDNVNSPKHYKLNEHGIECIDAIQASMSKEGFEEYLRGNVFKYLLRCNYKEHKVQDLHKAKWYLAKLISITDEDIIQPTFNFDKENTVEVTNEF